MSAVVKDLRAHRENLVKLIGKNAPSNEFLEGLLRLKATALKHQLSFYWLNDALLHVSFSVTSRTNSGREMERRLMIQRVIWLIDELDKFLHRKKIKLPKIRPEEFPVYKTEISEEEIKRCFIERGPLSGEWFFEVPVNLKTIKEKAEEERIKSKVGWLSREQIEKALIIYAKHIDLVCMESEKKGIHEQILEEHYLAFPIFDAKNVHLIEAKASANKIPNAVNQILEYKRLFKEDWPTSTIKSIGIVCSEWTKTSLELCKKNQILTWEVTCNEVIEV